MCANYTIWNIDMPLCPLGIQSGFINLTGNITANSIDAIGVALAPFTASFAPRNTPPALIHNNINEGADNTLLYRGTRYQLIGGVQICKPSHTGYGLPGQPEVPSLEIILTYVNYRVVGNYPSGIIVIVPIYNSSNNLHGAYLNQFIDSANNPAASLQTIFFENKDDNTSLSFAYNTCIDNVAPNSNTNNTIVRCYYFSNGIRLTGQYFQELMRMLTQQGNTDVPMYAIPPALRDNNASTVTEYKFVNGEKQVTAKSADGHIYTSQLSIASNEFKSQFQFFKKPISLTSSSFQKTCPYYATSKYKCVPFNSLNDLSGNIVIPGGRTLEDILAKNDAAKKSESSGMTLADLGETVGIGAAVAVSIGIIIVLGKMIWRPLMQRKPGS
jgi:hypothetical protein